MDIRGVFGIFVCVAKRKLTGSENETTNSSGNTLVCGFDVLLYVLDFDLDYQLSEAKKNFVDRVLIIKLECCYTQSSSFPMVTKSHKPCVTNCQT